MLTGLIDTTVISCSKLASQQSIHILFRSSNEGVRYTCNTKLVHALLGISVGLWTGCIICKCAPTAYQTPQSKATGALLMQCWMHKTNRQWTELNQLTGPNLGTGAGLLGFLRAYSKTGSSDRFQIYALTAPKLKSYGTACIARSSYVIHMKLLTHCCTTQKDKTCGASVY